MQISRLIIPLTFLFTFIITSSYASHLTAGHLSYKHVTGNQYKVTLSLVSDCGGVPFALPAEVRVTGCSGTSSDLVMTLLSVSDVSQSCDTSTFPTSCNGSGILRGQELYLFEADTILDPTCSYSFSYDECCRTEVVNAVNTLSDDLTVLANLPAPHLGPNSSAIISDMQPHYLCTGVPEVINAAAIDLDCDELRYQLFPALDGFSPIQYASGFSFLQPIPGISIDSLTGDLSFSGSMAGSFIVAIAINEYRSGVLVGRSIFDLQVHFSACSNTEPVLVGSGISNFSGTAQQIDPRSITMCPGDDFCFDVAFDELDSGQVLTLETNAQAMLPGATVSYSGVPASTATICWTAPLQGFGCTGVLVSATDDHCPKKGSRSVLIGIRYGNETDAGPDGFACLGSGIGIGVSGDAPYAWTSISGDSLLVGVNFSCDTCLNPVASPQVATTYVLQSGVGSNCPAQDTVLVQVTDTFTVSISPDSVVACPGDSVLLSASVSDTGSFDYAWLASGPLSSLDSSATFLIPSIAALTHNVFVSVSKDGCTIQAPSAIVVVSQPPFSFNIPIDSIPLVSAPITLSSGFPLGGNYTGTGVIGSSFDPMLAGIGTFSITYTDSLGCGMLMDSITVFNNVGITEFEDGLEFQVQPNPTYDYFQIIGNNSSEHVVEVYDMNGKQVRRWNENRTRYKVSDLAPGQYQVHVLWKNGKWRGKLLIVQ